MRSMFKAIWAAGFVVLAACTDAPTSGTGAQQARASETSLVPARVGGVDVKSFGAAGNGIADDTDAIRAAITEARSRGWGWTVYFPTGTYRITSTVLLPSQTWMEGAGSEQAEIVLDAAGARYAFEARGSAAGRVSGIIVEKLRFRTTAPHATQHALGAVTASNITFQFNEVLYMGLIHTDTHHAGDAWGNKPTATEADLTAGVTVKTNDGYGTGTGSEEAIQLGYTKDVRVEGNTLQDYGTGVTWWGGDADPSHGGGMGATRHAQNMLIQSNVITNVVNGIWGSHGDSIHVYYNIVSECHDVCLDAERTDNARFYENTARNAVNGVMAAFWFSKNVVFEHNHVHQTRSFGANRLFFLNNQHQDPGDMNVTVRYNDFHYTAGDGGVGAIYKEAAFRFYFYGNTLENTVIRGLVNNSGTAQISGNTLDFNRVLAGPAIEMGNSFGVNGATMSPISDGTWQLDIRGNTIRSSVGTQAVAGIYVSQWTWASISTYLYDNEVRGFEPSIRTQSDGGHLFRIWSNRTTGDIVTTGGTIQQSGNTRI